jgi:hypothetical protein
VWATRFDPENADALCYPCHLLWGGDLRADYKEFKEKQLGKKGLKKLYERSEKKVNRDKKEWKKKVEMLFDN